ncbi:aldo/keto reductase [Parapedobacter pyrenivorans]|uniref:aldo/keto reductase n=1 Tax=Parapedobacter pyrenivorans TaxID=1305674 RepID=UPI003342B595
MRYKKIGNTGLSVSEISFGGVEIGMPYGIGIKDESDMLVEEDAIRLLHRSIDEGINFFDTARHYGESERIMGRAFRGKRQQVVLASKSRHLRNSDGTIPTGRALYDFIRRSLDESLVALQTDYLDLYMVHYADAGILENEEVAAVFSKLKVLGLVRAIGVSVYKTEETQRAIATGLWDAIQLPFNLMDQRHGQYFDEAYRLGVGVIIRSVLMRGMLTDRMQQSHPALADVEAHINRYRLLVGKEYPGLSKLATQFALAYDAVSSALIGIDKLQYLRDAVATVEGNCIGEALFATLQRMAYPNQEFLNLAQWDKNGWL